MSGSLFDRLTVGSTTTVIDEDESIRRHILRMLTIRQGAVQTLPDYGLPDLNDLRFSRSDLIAECCRIIKNCLDEYEPRLTQVSVAPITGNHGDFNMAFSIKALKIDKDGRFSPWKWAVNLEGGMVTDYD